MSFISDGLSALRGLFSQMNKGTVEANQTLDEYVQKMPSHQNAIDILPGWSQAFPDELGLNAGIIHLHQDPRVAWALEKFGSVEGKKVLEIGPLEGGHTFMLDQQNPALLDAVEANKLCYLRCLVTKEIMKLRHANFYLGDCQMWLEERPDRYDLVVASGVLYHMKDPVRFLDAIERRADSLFLWTHYADDEAMPVGDPRRGAFVGESVVREHRGVSVRLHPRSYLGAWRDKAFCGGMNDLHHWIEKRSLLELLATYGFDDVEVWLDEPAHDYGPAFCLFARRSTPSPA